MFGPKSAVGLKLTRSAWQMTSTAGPMEETTKVMVGAIQPPKYKLTELGSITYAPFVKHEAFQQTGITAACEDMDEPALLHAA
jgi:hypothetical protein